MPAANELPALRCWHDVQLNPLILPFLSEPTCFAFGRGFFVQPVTRAMRAMSCCSKNLKPQHRT
jgi:hypothetical protein